MNKTAIKNFAIWARNKLIADIKYHAGLMGITKEGIQAPLKQSTGDSQFFDIGTAEPHAITGEALRQRERLVTILQEKAATSDYATAYKYILEEVAYTWFNRLIAIRFMEVNDYLPSRVRVLSSETGKNEPDIVTTPFDADLSFTQAEQQQILQMKADNQLDDLFRMLFIKQCNALNQYLPVLFEKTNDYTELLLTLSYIDPDGVVAHLVQDIDEDDFNIEKGGQVEIIGWLYQYYNTELNKQVYDGNLSKSKIPKELLPAATTIYTPHWAVKYMVENSLGRLWIEGHPDQKAEFLPTEAEQQQYIMDKSIQDGKWHYYLEEAEQIPEVQEKLNAMRQEYAALKPNDIRCIDPCMGSGHILVYLFDVLMQIYKVQGYAERDAVQSILTYNLYGLDIDDRAAQMAYFSVMMKARQYDRRIFSRGILPHIYAIEESNSINQDHLFFLGATLSQEEQDTAKAQAAQLIEDFTDAKEYGSILKIPSYNWELLQRFAENIDNSAQVSILNTGIEQTQQKLLRLITIGQMLSDKYDVVVTNPPYLGSTRFSHQLDSFVKKNYEDEKNDLSMVMYKTAMSNFSKRSGFVAFITTASWMTISSFEKLRYFLSRTASICSLVDFGTELFDGKVGHNPIVAWVSRNYYLNYTITAVRLVDYCYSRRDEKEGKFFNTKNYYTAKQSNFSKIPGSPVAYWLPLKIFELYSESTTMETVAHPKVGMQTSNNDKYLRLWFEINYAEFNGSSLSLKWIKYLKGGAYRKWYGNLEYLLFYNYDPQFVLQQRNARVLDQSYLRMKKCTWTDLTSGNNSFRLPPDDTFYDISGHCFFPDSESQLWLLAYANTKIFSLLKQVFNSTFHCQVGDVAKIVVPQLKSEEKSKIESHSEENVLLSKDDWDSYETSWDFQRHPLLRSITRLADAYAVWKAECERRFLQLKANEEELNRIFIDIYGLQDELTPDVADEDITVHRIFDTKDDVPEFMKGSNYIRTKRDEIVSLLSYAVGCMFGRYSLDKQGLVFAGGDFDSVYWKFKGQAPLDEQGDPIGGGYAGISLANNHYPKFHDAANWEDATSLSYEPDADGIIPITDEEYLEDDIVARLCDWLNAAYGADTLEENLDFIADALGGKGKSSREIIRNYFLKDFFKDHCKTYKKRPIYWLFDSGKQNGFKALIYLHRYTPDTIGNLRVDYLHKMQRVYESEINRMQDMIENSTNAREVGAAQKRKERLTKQLKECREYDEKIGHLAISRIELDLDDGVKVNYEKLQTASDDVFYEVLANAKAIIGKKKK